MSGMMVIPSVIGAEPGYKDIAVCGVSYIFPIVEGEDIEGTIYMKNIGSEEINTGFWVEINYAENIGFWQEC